MGKTGSSSKKEKRKISEDGDEHVEIKKKNKYKRILNSHESQNETENVSRTFESGNATVQHDADNHDEKKLQSPGKEIKISEENREKFECLLNDMDASKLKKVKRSKTKGKTEVEESTKNCNEVEEKSEIHPAIEYLLKWKKNRSEWSFKKVRQVWLLKNLYDDSKVRHHE